jgi:hypothetical protein
MDFTDLYEQGFAFEEMRGRIQIAEGKATLDNFTVDGPASKVIVSGSSDLVNQRFDQSVVVEPRIGSSVALASAVAGGPVSVRCGLSGRSDCRQSDRSSGALSVSRHRGLGVTPMSAASGGIPGCADIPALDCPPAYTALAAESLPRLSALFRPTGSGGIVPNQWGDVPHRPAASVMSLSRTLREMPLCAIPRETSAQDSEARFPNRARFRRAGGGKWICVRLPGEPPM